LLEEVQKTGYRRSTTVEDVFAVPRHRQDRPV